MQAFIDFLKRSAVFLANGTLIMWFYTMNMIALSWYATKHKLTIDTSIAVMYGGALTAYVGSKGYEFYQKSKVTKTTEKGDI